MITEQRTHWTWAEYVELPKITHPLPRVAGAELYRGSVHGQPVILWREDTGTWAWQTVHFLPRAT